MACYGIEMLREKRCRLAIGFYSIIDITFVLYVYIYILVSQGIPKLCLGLILQGTVGRQRQEFLPRKFVASTRANKKERA